MIIVLWYIRKDSENFQQRQIFIFNKQHTNFVARATHARRNSPIFRNLPPKNIPDQQKRVAFQKS